MNFDVQWRADFTSVEVDALHAEAFAPSPRDRERDWAALARSHSLGWATARSGDVLVGFLNVVWDGFAHAWLQDVMVAADARQQGVGSALVATARQQAAQAGCQWLHVDFTPGLAPFYLDACSFQASQAGLLPLVADVSDLLGQDRALIKGAGGGLDDHALQALAERMTAVPGVVGVTLGGSRARGEHHVDSDVDLGVYYRPGLDVAALGALARQIAGPDAQVTAPGGWGPWVDGGGWLDVDGVAVDWIYREVDRVRASWAAAQRGEVDFGFQVGHPLGVPGFAYAGEIAMAQVLADPTGELDKLHRQARAYPPALREALVDRLWEADFLLTGAAKVVARADAAYVAGCLFRVVGLCAHALHAHAGRWLVNEKGAIASAGALPGAPPGFSQQAHHLLGHLGTTPALLRTSLEVAGALVADVRTATAPEGAAPQPL